MTSNFLFVFGEVVTTNLSYVLLFMMILFLSFLISSIELSRKILEHYHSLENLINALKSAETPEGLLTSLQVTDKRKLGKVLAQRIYNYLIIN